MRRNRVAIGALPVGLLIAVAAGSASADARQLGEWKTAEIVSNVNDPASADGCPIESPDGLSLYIASTRSGGDNDIWVATRASVESEFGTPDMLPAPVNSDAQDFCPTPLRGKYLLFVSTRGGTDAYGTTACGLGDIYLTRKNPATDAWTEPMNLGCAPTGPNGAGMEYGPSLVETDAGTLLFFSSGAPVGGGTQDIYVSEQQPDGGFGPPHAVTELNTATDDVMPNVSKNGLEIVFASTRTDLDGEQGSFDIYTSRRDSVDDDWSTPVNLGTAVNTSGSETRPSLSWDGERLYFGRSGEIYVSSR